MAGLKFGLLVCVLFSWVSSNPIDGLADKKPFTIEEAILGELSVSSFGGKWISDNEIEYFDKVTKEVKVVNVATNKTQVVLKASVLEKYKTTKYSFSADRNFVLLCYDEKTIFRFSRKSKYVVYSIKDGAYYDVSKKEEIQLAEWGPKNNTLVYIKDNNIYLIRSITSKIETLQITTNGEPGKVFNGISNWYYKGYAEEILSPGEAFWFSPDGTEMTFATFFNDKVIRASMVEYGEPGDLKYQYTKRINVTYPKAGTANPTWELRHVYLNDTKNSKVFAKYFAGREIMLDLKWANDDYVIYMAANRVQNKATTYLCEITHNHCFEFLKNNTTKAWANTNLPIFNKNITKFLLIDAIPTGKNDKFNHLLYDDLLEDARPLTGGPSEVLKVLAWDEAKKLIYFTATEENNATTTQVFSVCESKGCKPVCLTCRIKSPEGRGCKEASASFSKNFSYVIVTCNGPDPRMVYLYKNVQPLDKPLAILEDNSKLRKSLAQKLMPEIMNLTVEVPGPFMADVRLFLPPNMDRTGKTKYPLLIYVYGGPESKNINDAFKLDWAFYMSTNLSVIYGLIDGRNTLRKGQNMLFAGYRALGTLEMEDQINVTRTLQKKFAFIDSARTGIWGWSYGGYATTKILEIDTQNIFKCGIAVAPVADWIYYHTMYTEKYMGLPQENKKGYEKSSVLRDVSNLRNKQYFLIHGNADDNVHYQNAMMIAKVLERNNIPFELMSYPDEDHSLENVRKHFYYTMSSFWKRCFKL